MKKYIAETIGTFALVLVGTGAVVLDQHTSGSVTNLGISAAFGLIVTAMILVFGKISGTHINPAVSIALAVNRSFSWEEIAPYLLSQMSGALLASIILKFSFPANEFLGVTLPSGSAMQSFWLELFLTFCLMMVILISPPKIAAVTIGLTVGLEAYFAGPICGASMNPIRSLAPAIVSGHLEHIWVYISAPIIGAVLSVFLWKIIKPKEN
ncbi:MAG: aquaporin [Bacteroidia bacterium]|nr:aquaporin [Sphingobacteriaceae bacterium]MBK7818508.1 aquaporin [Sphingobacteriaceae bacterium]MBP9069739.1 aquaporin [Bacteroidia bacterium]